MALQHSLSKAQVFFGAAGTMCPSKELCWHGLYAARGNRFCDGVHLRHLGLRIWGKESQAAGDLSQMFA
jgi:hypothetical protein